MEYICPCCGPRLEAKLNALSHGIKHLERLMEAVLESTVTDPAKLAELTNQLNAKKAAIDAAVASNPIPPV